MSRPEAPSDEREAGLPLDRYAAILARLLQAGAQGGGREPLAALLDPFGVTVDAWKAADAAWSAKLLQAVQRSRPAGETSVVDELVLRLLQHRSRLEKPSAEPWIDDFLPAWTAPPARTTEETVPKRGDATTGAALPFRGKAGETSPPPRLSIADHATLCAEIAVKIDSVDRLLARRGITTAEKDALDEHYRRLVARDPRAQTEWQAAFERRRRECVGTGAGR